MIKKNIAFIALLLISFSCKKNKNTVLTLGESKNYELTNHDVFAQGFDGGPDVNWETVEIDLDNNGTADIRFKSIEDSVAYPESSANYWVNAVILDDKFTFLENPGTDNEYEVHTTVHDYYGTYPRKTTVVESYCEYVDGAYYSNSNYRKAKIFNLSDKVSKDEVFESKYPTFDIYEKLVEYGYNEFNAAEDTLFGYLYKPMEVCTGAPLNELFYIAFKYESGSDVKYGWVELIVTNNNKITVKLSGISED